MQSAHCKGWHNPYIDDDFLGLPIKIEAGRLCGVCASNQAEIR